ncbi:MAG: DNA-3-methyladenine glycosylase 2 family protein [Verrucomicrobia bacterium]|nr:DNA-3-methyladenine glycosylase 2 family protein [Verrucomicrobiota bacterium]
MYSLAFTLPAISPFRLDLTVWALKRRSRNVVDSWEKGRYVRVLDIENTAVKVEVEQRAGKNEVFVVAKSYQRISGLKAKIAQTLSAMLGLQVNLAPFYKMAKKNSAINELATKFKGIKPPRFPNLFETLANAIAFQQLSLEAGFSLINKLAMKYGRSFKEKEEVFFSFPEPNRIARCSIKDLTALGFSRHKSEALILIASVMANADKALNEEFLQGLPNEEAVRLLCCLKGIGRWSAEYTLLRGLGRIEVLPGDDVGLHRSIKPLLNLRKDPDFERIKKIEREWHPYAGMIYFHLLLNKLFDQGMI